MKNSFIIASREFKERINSRSFILMAIVGPLLVLGILYFLFIASGTVKKDYNILVADPIELMNNKIKKDSTSHLNYYFINAYVDPDDFATAKVFQKFDAVLVVNEKVLSNNHVFLYLRTKLSSQTIFQIRRELERRLEELKVKAFTKLTLEKYWQIKHAVSLEVRDTYRPHAVGNYKLAAYAGYAFGIIIFVFIFLFGMTILRSTNKEKSSRIAEVLLSSVKPRELLSGKIMGIGLAALIQFVVWILVVGVGLSLIRAFVFPDLFDVSNMNLNSGDGNTFHSYNDLVRLVFEQIDFVSMLSLFVVLLVLGYLFFGSLFAALGAAQGSSSDGQQFLIPLLCLFFIGVWSGYFVVNNPDSMLSTVLSFLPFTSPITLMVKFAQGYSIGASWQLFVSLLILIVGVIVNLYFAGKLFRKGLLSHGYRLSFSQFFSWLR